MDKNLIPPKITKKISKSSGLSKLSVFLYENIISKQLSVIRKRV